MAPAIKNPHAAVFKHTNICVSQAAISQITTNGPHNSCMVLFLNSYQNIKKGCLRQGTVSLPRQWHLADKNPETIATLVMIGSSL